MIIATHDGVFHADDVFTTAFLQNFYSGKSSVKFIRTRNPAEIKNAYFVYDVGGIFNPNMLRFDHHFKECPLRNDKNNTPYSSFGLVWREFGSGYLNYHLPILDNESSTFIHEVWNKIDEDFVKLIDCIDNGIKVDSPIGSVISNFNLTWNEEKEDNDTEFYLAVDMAKKIFDNVIKKAISQVKADWALEKAYKHGDPFGYVLCLDRYIPFDDFVNNNKDIEFVLYRGSNGFWRFRTSSNFANGFKPRKEVNKDFWGLEGEELKKISGIKTANFVHNTGFTGEAETFEDILIMIQS
jgi:uncharacterized UPF0160 family protein